MTSKNLINADTVNTGSVNYKNRIINGDFQINQRQKPVISNDSDYPVDRVFVDAINSEVVVTDEIVYSPNEGILVTETDPFGDSSQVAMYRFEDASSGGKVTCDNDSSYNGQWKDDSGNNTDGSYDTGKFDNASSFDGSHFIDFGSELNSIFDSSKNITVSLWYKTNTTNSPTGLFSFRNSSNNPNFILNINGNNVGNYEFIGTDGSNSIHLVDSGSTSNNDVWRHLVANINYNSKDWKLYINGRLEYAGNNASLTYLDSSNNVTRVGCNYNLQYFNGLIDQVRIFNKALTDDEVRKLYVEDLNYIQKKHLRVEVNRKDSNANINPYKYKFEGQDIKDILTNDMTLSFDFMSSITGSFDVMLNTFCLDGTQEQFTTSFDYNGNDFEKISVNIPQGTFTKPLIDDERQGAEILIASNAQSVYNAGDVVRLTNVQLEVGSVATEFEVLPYDKQLERCMRYYEVCKPIIVNLYANAAGIHMLINPYTYKIKKRIIPSLSYIKQGSWENLNGHYEFYVQTTIGFTDAGDSSASGMCRRIGSIIASDAEI